MSMLSCKLNGTVEQAAATHWVCWAHLSYSVGLIWGSRETTRSNVTMLLRVLTQICIQVKDPEVVYMTAEQVVSTLDES